MPTEPHASLSTQATSCCENNTCWRSWRTTNTCAVFFSDDNTTYPRSTSFLWHQWYATLNHECLQPWIQRSLPLLNLGSCASAPSFIPSSCQLEPGCQSPTRYPTTCITFPWKHLFFKHLGYGISQSTCTRGQWWIVSCTLCAKHSWGFHKLMWTKCQDWFLKVNIVC